MELGSVPFDIPQDIKMEIQAIPYALAFSSKDRLMWRDSPRGELTWKVLIVWLLGWIRYQILMEVGFGSFILSQRFSSSYGNVPTIVLESMIVLLLEEWTSILTVPSAIRNLNLSSMLFEIVSWSGLSGMSWEQWDFTEIAFPQILGIGWWLMGDRTQPKIKIPLCVKSFSLSLCGTFGRVGTNLFLRGGHRIQV